MLLLLSKWPLVVVLVLYKPIVWPSAHLPGFSLFCWSSTVWLQPVPAPATCVCNQVSPKLLQQTNSTPPVQPVSSAPLLQPCPFSVPVSHMRGFGQQKLGPQLVNQISSEELVLFALAFELLNCLPASTKNIESHQVINFVIISFFYCV